MTHMRPKYRAVPTVVDNIRFASKAEAKRYGELKLLRQAGEITGLLLQPKYPLHARERNGNGLVKVGEYRADFAYERGGKLVVEDVKGMKTPMYRWKKKHAEAEWGITITEITK